MNPSALPPELLATLRTTFAAEADDRVRAMVAAAGRVRAGAGDGADGEALDELFRHAHSLKSGAAAVGMASAAELAHVLEDALSTRTRLPTSAVLTEALDTLAEAVVDAGVDVTDAVVRLRDEAAADAPTLAGDAGASPAPERERERERERDGDGGTTTSPARRRVDRDGFVRVAGRFLDDVMGDAGDLAVRVARVEHLTGAVGQLTNLAAKAVATGDEVVAATALRELGDVQRELDDVGRRIAAGARSLRDDVATMRLVELRTVLEPAAREARRIARELGKDVEVVVVGGEVAADRANVQALTGPLAHAVRNAVDHGIEEPGTRAAAGLGRATLRLVARQEGATLVVDVEDDGGGIDEEAVVARAIERGLDPADLPASELLFLPGFSTRDRVSTVSGRGVGLDAIRREVEDLYGTAELDAVAPRGTRLRLRLPLGVAGTTCLVVRVADQRFALPVTAVDRIVGTHVVQDRLTAGRPTIEVDGDPVLVVDLGTVVGARAVGADGPSVVVEHAGRRRAVRCAEVLGQLELVLKPLPEVLGRLDLVSGVAAMPDGGAIPVLAAPALASSAAGTGHLRADERVSDDGTGATDGSGAGVPSRVAVVDDSVTSRTLEQAVLSAAGYEVAAFEDGAQALRALEDGAFDLVVTDLEMPVMDGLALVRAIRADEALANLPVILVTSRSSDVDRELALDAGVDVHLDKAAFDQRGLLAAVQDLLP